MAWAYFATNVVFGLAFSILLARTDPGLFAERMKPGPGEQDRVTRLVGLVLLLLQVILAGMDAGRFHWTAPVSLVAQAGAFVLVFIGYGVAAWATYSNRFFSSAVRLQPDRQQIVVDKGPYAVVRHPGYAGMFLYLPLSGVVLGSWLAGVAAGVPMAIVLLRRTLLEDKMLLKGLPGYETYASRVKYRLIPGVW